MQRAPLSTHGLRLALAAMAGLAVAPAARADEGLSLPVDPAALAATLVQPATVDVAEVTSDAAAVAVVDVVPVLTPVPAPQAVPAAAVVPMAASEPQPRPLGTPPPPAQPVGLPSGPAPDVVQPQYQFALEQYQTLVPDPQSSLAAISEENYGAVSTAVSNIASQIESQYHEHIARYQLGDVVLLTKVGSADTDVLAAAPDIDSLAAAAPAPVPDAGTARAPDPAAPAKPAAVEQGAGAAALTVLSSRNARPATPTRVRPQHPQSHRSRPSHRRPTRPPPSPSRAPVIPVSSAGAAPLGGADGGGLHSLLLGLFALALVDSVRRAVREAAPPAARDLDKRRKRPG